MDKIKLKSLSKKELEEFFVSMGEKAFRATQLMQWLYKYRVDDFSKITNMSKVIREKLNKTADISKAPVLAKQISKNSDSIKIALGLNKEKTEMAECVALIDGKRVTACISSQIGCAYGCKFCSTATMGFVRNLRKDEIIEQLICLQDALGEKRITNVVFMGMGEPLSNMDNVLGAIETIQSNEGFMIGGRKITISTCGLAPQIRKLADLKKNYGLAISLNAPEDKLRSTLMPVNNQYSIKEVIEAAKYYFEKAGRRVTFEYILLDNINDSLVNLKKLKVLLNNFPCKLNLISFNTKKDSEFKTVDKSKSKQILEYMRNSKFTVTMRKSIGTDITAACGQLYIDLKKNL